jgi:hypothetical protein
MAMRPEPRMDRLSRGMAPKLFAMRSRGPS